MSELQHLLVTIFGLTITFFVPAVVWTMLAVGLYQLVRSKIRRVRVLRWGSRLLMREGSGQQVG